MSDEMVIGLLLVLSETNDNLLGIQNFYLSLYGLKKEIDYEHFRIGSL